MANASLTWLADALRAEGCTVVEEGDWKHRGRPSGAFNPYAVLWHHTAATASYSNPFPSKDVLINGRPDLAGPLCHVGIGYDGVCHVIAAGRANHAGNNGGSGPVPAGDGNAQLVGFEIDYNGTQPMSPEQKDAATRCSAACLKRFGRDENYARRHEETSTTGKWDTGGVDGPTLRRMVGDYLATGGDMPLTDADAILVAETIWNRWKVYEPDGSTVKTYGGAMSTMYQGMQAVGSGGSAIESAEKTWNQYKVEQADGTPGPPYGQSMSAMYQHASAGLVTADAASRRLLLLGLLLLVNVVVIALLITVIVRQ